LLTEPYDVKVLNDINATTDLLEKRGEVYSSRPRFVVASVAWHVSFFVDPLTYSRHEILSSAKRGVTSPYGDYWRRWRKVKFMINLENRLIISTRMLCLFGIASAHSDEWEGCAVLPRTTGTRGRYPFA
jgi:hypothetical protein